LGVLAKESICVGDAPMDMQIASKSGCLASIGVATEQVSESELLKVTPYEVDSFSQLLID